MLIIIGKAQFEKQVAELHSEAMRKVNADLQSIRSVTDLSEKVKSLRGEISKLEIEKGKREEEISRKEREMEHKVGLERKRQAFELESGKKEAILKVREENLASDKARFEEQIKFHEKRFTEEVGYLKEMLSDIVQRLPSAEFTADLTPHTSSRKK